MLKKVLNSLIILLSLVMIGTVSLIAVFMLPTQRMKTNTASSVQVFKDEGLYKDMVSGYNGTRYDNFTDSLILDEATYDDETSALNRAMRVYGGKEGMTPDGILEEKLINNNDFEELPYERYWHGNLVVVKPLLMIFTYQDIRILNAFLQALLIGVIIYLMIKKGLSRFIFPLALSIMLINPLVISQSIQFSAVFYIFLISFILILTFNRKLKVKNIYIYLFLIIGALTSFFDFLTFPLLSLGMPLILYFIMNDEDKFKEKLKKLLKFVLMWSIGYFGMWVSKWVIGSLLLQDNLFDSALNAVKFRSSVDNFTHFTRFDAIFANINLYAKKTYLLIFLFVFAFYGYRAYKNKINFKKVLNTIIIIGLICLAPFAWYFLSGNHSYIHYWFTYRNLAITFFGVFVILESIIARKSEKHIS